MISADQQGASLALKVEGLKKSFGGVPVLRGVDLEIPPGGVTALLGGSGSGKSVLLKCIAGLMEADEGRVEIFGKHREGRGATDLGFMFQGDTLLDSLTAGDNIALPLRETTSKRESEISKTVAAMLEKLDLSDVAAKFPGDLSGGMRRRVSLGRALVREPRLMLFDEPTTGLDPMRRNSVLEMVWEYQARFGFTALFVTHDVPASLLIADHFAMLDGGVISQQGEVGSLKEGKCDALDRFLHSEEILVAELLEVSGNCPEGKPEDLASLLEGRFESGVLFELSPGSEPSGLAGRLNFPRAATLFRRSLKEASGDVSSFFSLPSGAVGVVAASDKGYPATTGLSVRVAPFKGLQKLEGLLSDLRLSKTN